MFKDILVPVDLGHIGTVRVLAVVVYLRWNDSERVEVAFEFPSATRFSPPPLSLLRVDAQPDSLLVHAYHTFPDGCAVVKSQSLFEW